MADVKGSSQLHINFLPASPANNEFITLIPNSIHCFTGSADEKHETLFLSDDEIKIAKKFRFQKDKALYEETHHSLRKLLSAYLSVPPSEIMFEKDPAGKPYIDLPDTSLQFNLSHSRERYFIAIAETSLGVDIEFIKPDFDFKSIIDTYFLKADKQHILHAPDPAEEFFRMWAIKEAVLKFFGRGISDLIKKINVTEKRLEVSSGHELFITSFTADGYAFAVCSGLPFDVRLSAF